ncbi:hypothetical protein O1L60_15925 [Streptomyces diastatochromogenes]|nr:hypothetical protein [Streptomyces diastatochromogenes]
MNPVTRVKTVSTAAVAAALLLGLTAPAASAHQHTGQRIPFTAATVTENAGGTYTVTWSAPAPTASRSAPGPHRRPRRRHRLGHRLRPRRRRPPLVRPRPRPGRPAAPRRPADPPPGRRQLP